MEDTGRLLGAFEQLSILFRCITIVYQKISFYFFKFENSKMHLVSCWCGHCLFVIYKSRFFFRHLDYRPYDTLPKHFKVSC